MRKLICLLVLAMVVVVGAGCAATLPTNSYTPQNFVRTMGKVDMGTFTYVAFVEGKKVKKSNQIQNTAAGQIYISTDVADFVKRGNALELEKSGVMLDPSAPIRLDANILEFKADDLGYSVDWSYKIQYMIVNKSDSQLLFDKTFSPSPKKGGKFGNPSDYANVVSETILGGYDLFIRDPDAKRILEEAALPQPSAQSSNVKK